MANTKRYPIAKDIQKMCTMLDLDPARVLRRAGLSQSFLQNESQGATSTEYFALWEAVYDEVGDPMFALEIGQKLAGSPFIPAMLAFSSSPNTEVGLKRLALFKPLVGPVALDIKSDDESLEFSIRSSDEDAPMPASASAFELVYFLESVRKFTGRQIIPVAIGMPEGLSGDIYKEYFGVDPEPALYPTIKLTLEDARRPLLSENEEFWSWLEIDLKRQLAAQEAKVAISHRVRAELIDLLPSGESSSDAVSKRLGMSKRSLQRRLHEEGEAFQSVLDATRAELAIRYLSKGDMRVEEISYLLAYRDPNSFYRAFHGWTGMTPTEARGQPVQ